MISLSLNIRSGFQDLMTVTSRMGCANGLSVLEGPVLPGGTATKDPLVVQEQVHRETTLLAQVSAK